MIDLTHLNPKRRVTLPSNVCAYCGEPFSIERPGTHEHVIGRRFVPKGTLSAHWNLLLRACQQCNAYKARLENDLSAITMQPDAYGRYACDDERLIREAERKARTINQRTGRQVAEPEPPMTVRGSFGAATMSFGFDRPAQADDHRVFDLARLQLAGFFSMLTYQENEGRGYYWLGDFAPVVVARKADWGNPCLRWVEEMARTWDYRLHAIGAEGFYKIWIRRRPDDPVLWAWAMEWNKNFRLAGFIGEEAALAPLREQVPQLKMTMLHQDENSWIRYRREEPLSDANDQLFDMPTFD